MDLVIEVSPDVKETLKELITEDSCIFDIWDMEHEILFDEVIEVDNQFIFVNVGGVYIAAAFLAFF